VPLAKVRGCIARILECVTDGENTWTQKIGHAAAAVFSTSREVRMNQMPGWILSGSHRDTGWRADRRVHVELREAHSVCRELVNVWSLDDRVAETARVGIAHVIDENEDDVQPIFGMKAGSQEENGRKESHHVITCL
jgi:hypothetical protein